ncbi:CBN-ACR-21 protein [Aphelenchoides avenae]|nr:CBN-ACR-21 protein [Aphelenchus avenae]
MMITYENDVRPSLKHDMPVVVTFSFSLTQIIDVDERNQIITTSAWIKFAWTDHKLIWNPEEYDNITRMHVPHENIWRPDIVLYNNAASNYVKSVMSTDALVNYDGNVSWTMAGIFRSSCGLDVRYYPFDFQNCILKFASWAYDGTKIDITLPSRLGDQSNYMTSTEWHLHLIRAEKSFVVYSCCPEPYPFVDVHIAIQRRPMFYVFNLILPCVLISGIALLGFYMPSDSGEKVTLGITSLLSTTVFLMLVAEGMPPTSEALPLIGVYYGITIFIVSLATAMTVFTLNVHHHGRNADAVPEFVQRLAFDYAAKFLFLKIEHYHSINEHVEYFHKKEHAGDSLAATRKKPKGGTISTAALLAKSYRSPTPMSRTANYRRTLSEIAKKPHANDLSPDLTSMKKRVSFSNDSIASLAVIPNGTSSCCHSPAPNCQSPVSKSLPNHSPVLSTKSANAVHTLETNRSRAQHGETSTVTDRQDEDMFENEFLRVLCKVHAIIERNEMRLAEKDRRNAARLEWHQVALVLDRFLFFSFVAITAFTSFGIIYQRHLFVD